jgi:hypothetical protein
LGAKDTQIEVLTAKLEKAEQQHSDFQNTQASQVKEIERKY